MKSGVPVMNWYARGRGGCQKGVSRRAPPTAYAGAWRGCFTPWQAQPIGEGDKGTYPSAFRLSPIDGVGGRRVLRCFSYECSAYDNLRFGVIQFPSPTPTSYHTHHQGQAFLTLNHPRPKANICTQPSWMR